MLQTVGHLKSLNLVFKSFFNLKHICGVQELCQISQKVRFKVNILFIVSRDCQFLMFFKSPIESDTMIDFVSDLVSLSRV